MTEPKLTEAQRGWGVPLNDDDTTGVLWFHEPVVARMIAAAVQTARAEAWDEGYQAHATNLQIVKGGSQLGEMRQNPYRDPYHWDDEGTLPCPAPIRCPDQTLCPPACQQAGNREGNHRRERDEAIIELGQAHADRDAARAQAAQATTDAADLRARVEAVVAPWPPGARKGDVYRALDGGA